jgi:uncharacterized membrane protein HdeD (DUF308 family)
MSADAAVAEMKAEVQEYWWIPLIQGIAAIILGILLLTYTGATSAIIAGFVGFYWLISGVVNLVAIFVDRTMWGWKLFIGVLGIFAGFLVVTNLFEHPIATTLGLASIFVWVMGIQGLIIGIVEIVQAFQGAGWGRGVLGFFTALIGLFLIFNPVIGGLALPLVIGVIMIVMGGFAIFMAFKLKSA